MPAATLALTIEKGATFRHTLRWSTGDPPALVDLAPFTARMQIRAPANTPGVRGGPTVLHSLTTENGGITLNAGGEQGRIDLLISAANTETLTGVAGVYDLELVEGAEVIRLLQGDIAFSPEVTRP